MLSINANCTQCDNCRLFCPEDAIRVFDHSYQIDAWSCTHCLFCMIACPAHAIEFDSEY